MRAFAKIVFGMVTGLTAAGALAQEVTLRSVSAWAEGNVFSRNMERFVEKVNAEGKGIVQIRHIGGGAKVMPPFEVGNAVKAGIVDIAHVAGGFYTNLMPEADALSVATLSMAEQRTSGALDFINRLWGEKMNVYYLGRALDRMPYHIFLKRPVSKPDLTGMRLRSIPLYRAFIEALGGSVVTLPPGELYTALERGVVEGYGWPAIGLFDLSLQEQTRARIDPGFYDVEVGVLVNLNVWKKLNQRQRDYLQRQALWMEQLNAENEKTIAEDKKKQAAAGIQTIELKGAERDAYLKKAYDSIWANIAQRSPENGPKLKALLYR